jgi:hypothetical protein
MNDEKPLTGVRKRAQIDSTNKQVFTWVAGAAAAAVIAVVVTLNLSQTIAYQTKVNGELGKTADTMKQNIENVKQLRLNIDALSSSQNLNLAAIKDPDSTPLQVILDALPTKEDRVNIGSSMQRKVLAPSGVGITSLGTVSVGNVETGVGGASGGLHPTAQPISFSFVISGSYEVIHQALKDIERTIRPIVITSLNLQGTQLNLQASVTVTTYYVPPVSWQTSKTTVPVGNEAPADATTTDTTGGTQ